jgi:Peptidase family M1 domain
MKSHLALALAIAVGAVSRVLAVPAGPAEDLRRFDALRVGASSAPVRDLVLSCGRATMTLKSGSVAPIRAGGEVVGLYFEGAGALEYRSEDPVEFSAAERQNRKTAGLAVEKTGKALVFRDTFDHLTWLASGKPLPELPGGAGMWSPAESRQSETSSASPSLEAAFRKSAEKTHRIRGAPLSQLFTLQRANAPEEPLVVAQLEGGKEDLRYVFDGFEGRSESLFALRHPDFGDAEMRRNLDPIVLSDQPIGRDRRDPLSPSLVLADARIDLTASEGKDAELVVDETLFPQRRAARAVRLDLLSVSYARSGAAGLDRRRHRVRSVTDASGRALAFSHRNGALVVVLAEPAPVEQPLKLRFQIEGDYLVRPGGDNYWMLGTEPWFPQPGLYGQYYTFHARVKVRKPFIAFAPGTTVARGTEGDYNTVETDIDKPVQFAVILGGRYEFEEETRKGITVRVASYAGKNSRAIKQLTNLAFGIIEYYQTFLGPFPFPEFNILEINSYGFGQAPPATMFITREAFNPYIGEANQFFSNGVNERFAHEIAHQYWGHVVKMPSEEEQWLTESFAEYSAAIFLRDFKGKSSYDSLLAIWKSRASDSTAAAPIALANRLEGSPEAFLDRQNLIYWKGAWLLSRLHRELGEQAFLTFLKSYQKTFRWKFGSTKSVAGMLQFLTGRNYMAFFEKYYWGIEMP